MLVEFCRYGNILDYMHCHRKEFINQINNEDKIDPSITDQGLRAKSRSGQVRWASYEVLSTSTFHLYIYEDDVTCVLTYTMQ